MLRCVAAELPLLPPSAPFGPLRPPLPLVPSTFVTHVCQRRSFCQSLGHYRMSYTQALSLARIAISRGSLRQGAHNVTWTKSPSHLIHDPGGPKLQSFRFASSPASIICIQARLSIKIAIYIHMWLAMGLYSPTQPHDLRCLCKNCITKADTSGSCCAAAWGHL